MNLIKVFFLLSLPLILLGKSYSQDLLDGNRMKVASIDSNGIIHDLSTNQIGQFLPNGNITDAKGDVIGKIENNEFKDISNFIIGNIDSSNKIFDANGMFIGEILSTKKVLDVNGHILGETTSYVDPKHVAAYYFFFFNNI